MMSLSTCHCRAGVERDNCPDCEATGMRIDFARIRKQGSRSTEELDPQQQRAQLLIVDPQQQRAQLLIDNDDSELRADAEEERQD
jgi:hypothetical protein